MKYWDEVDNGRKKQVVEKPVIKESVINLLAYIKRGHMPDWNYERHQDMSLPNEYYPLHVAMNAAIKAIEAQDESFFAAIEAECNRAQITIDDNAESIRNGGFDSTGI